MTYWSEGEMIANGNASDILLRNVKFDNSRLKLVHISESWGLQRLIIQDQR